MIQVNLADTEVIVVDNGSKDESHSIVFTFGDKVKMTIFDDVKSPYACRNIGIKQAKGNILILLDSNCVPSRDWLMSGIKTAESQVGNDIVSGPLEFEFGDDKSLYQIGDALTYTSQKDSFEDGKSYPGGHLFIKREVIESIGYFPVLRSGGDIYWTQKATSMGFKLGYSASCSVSYVPKQKKAFVNKAKRIGQGYVERWKLEDKSLFLLFVTAIKLSKPPNPKSVSKRLRKLEIAFDDYPMYKIYFIVWQYRILRAIEIFRFLFKN